MVSFEFSNHIFAEDQIHLFSLMMMMMPLLLEIKIKQTGNEVHYLKIVNRFNNMVALSSLYSYISALKELIYQHERLKDSGIRQQYINSTVKF